MDKKKQDTMEIQENKGKKIKEKKTEEKQLNIYKEENIHLNEIIAEKEESIKKEIENNQYLQANIENMRKRHQIEILDVEKYAIKNFAKKLLSIVDSIEQGIDYIDSDNKNDVKTIREGLVMSHKMFLKILSEFNINQIVSDQAKFNPEKHQAISVVNVNNIDNQFIVNTLQKGYEINDRILRSAKVIVCKKD